MPARPSDQSRALALFRFAQDQRCSMQDAAARIDNAADAGRIARARAMHGEAMRALIARKHERG